MAEKEICPVLTASNGSKAFFMTPQSIAIAPGKEGTELWLTGRWPLAEFDELVKFVQEHRFPEVDMKIPELEDSNERQTEG